MNRRVIAFAFTLLLPVLSHGQDIGSLMNGNPLDSFNKWFSDMSDSSASAANGKGDNTSSENSDETKKITCKGKQFNAMSDPDWNNMYPMTIMGAKMGNNSDPPLMHVDAICQCTSYETEEPVMGVGFTYWQPNYLAEIEKIAGCSASLGGQQILSGYKKLNSSQGFYSPDKGAAVSTRMQMHFYDYPLFDFFDEFKEMSCYSSNGFNLTEMSEIDSTWQDDEWGGIFNPEAGLLAGKTAQYSCVVDSVAATIWHPLDVLFWCAGSWGGIYPMTGNANQSLYPFQLNQLVLAKYIARQHRLGMLYQTIGPDAVCQAHPNPIWIKSEYRVNQVWPIRRTGAPLEVGAVPVRQRPYMITNEPSYDSTVDLIWQGQQCCIRSEPSY